MRVAATEPLDPGQPVAVGSLAEIAADPTKWDRRFVVYEGGYVSRFEVSALDGDIWLETTTDAVVVVTPSPGNPLPRRVRVTGFPFCRPGARYGHLGGYRFQLVATRLEYLPAAASR